MSKYSVRFCNCGTIHLMNNDNFDWMEEDFGNRSVVQVCRNCGFTKETYLEPYEDGFCHCGHEINEAEFEGDSNHRVIISRGIRIPLNESFGHAAYISPANHYFDDDGNLCTVDTKRLIEQIKHDYKDDADNILYSIAGYVSGIDWSGTKYGK